MNQARVDAVARCLAKIDGKFVGASQWAGDRGAAYHDAAERVLDTVDRFDSGVQSGGLPERVKSWPS